MSVLIVAVAEYYLIVTQVKNISIITSGLRLIQRVCLFEENHCSSALLKVPTSSTALVPVKQLQ